MPLHCARRGSGEVDPIGLLEVADAGSNVCYDSGTVPPGDVRQRREPGILTGADVRVDRIDSGGLAVDEYLPRTRGRVGLLLEREDLGATKFVNHHCFHMFNL
jgi:hypothetical protein